MAKCFFLFLVSFSLFAQTSQKPLVEGFQGMVVSTHPVASDVGLTILKKGGIEMIAVPAFMWHTYVMLTEYAVTYETMMGKYDPQTWKNFFSIAPEENALNSQEYLQNLQKVANTYNQSNI